ncbi:MAG: Maf family protein [Armatimonadota bacterium]
MPRIVLASASPRRRMLLEQIGLPFEVIPSQSPEMAQAHERPADHVRRAAALKASSVAPRVEPEAVLIGADTIVCLDGSILGKPSSRGEAREMLHRLSGHTHTVYTGLAVGRAGSVVDAPVGPDEWHQLGLDTGLEATRVKFRQLSDAEIGAYVDTGEPLDKAGAYGIQGRGALLVQEIRGCYFNVVGLPLVRLAGMLGRLGIHPLELQDPGAVCTRQTGTESA